MKTRAEYAEASRRRNRERGIGLEFIREALKPVSAAEKSEMVRAQRDNPFGKHGRSA